MTYFLDFDRTLFDTDAYNRGLLDIPACKPFRDELQALLEAPPHAVPTKQERDAIWDKLSALLISGELSFAPGELAKYVYPDVPEFLRMLGNEAIIITYGEKTRQKAKVDSAFAGIVRLTTLYTEDKLKAEYFEQYPHLLAASSLFVDDRALELETMEKLFPQVKLFQMVRGGGPGDGRWTVVRSLSDLP